jgi:hypothetical protein
MSDHINTPAEDEALPAEVRERAGLPPDHIEFGEVISVRLSTVGRHGGTLDVFQMSARTRTDALFHIKGDVAERIVRAEEGLVDAQHRLEALTKLRARLETELANAS